MPFGIYQCCRVCKHIQIQPLISFVLKKMDEIINKRNFFSWFIFIHMKYETAMIQEVCLFQLIVGQILVQRSGTRRLFTGANLWTWLRLKLRRWRFSVQKWSAFACELSLPSYKLNINAVYSCWLVECENCVFNILYHFSSKTVISVVVFKKKREIL